MPTPPERLPSEWEQGRAYGELIGRVESVERQIPALREEFNASLDAQTRTLTGNFTSEMDRRFSAQQPVLKRMGTFLDEEDGKRRASERRDRKLDELIRVGIAILGGIVLYNLQPLTEQIVGHLPPPLAAGFRALQVIGALCLLLYFASRIASHANARKP